MFYDKKELRNIYYLAFTSIIVLIITLITKEIAWGFGVGIPLFLILVSFDSNILKILKKIKD
ncbi:hypothetical protein [Vagococcus fluvialis]|uniref:hypothetical protein n=1 Tax=Vagococcus fluvialis TaxID=2738 RepID=UPI002034911A|nr:hypothetical protein [Vagococcus fluvialis]MCM2139867.1 hypothetical protein [Vagococcus fluvialis]